MSLEEDNALEDEKDPIPSQETDNTNSLGMSDADFMNAPEPEEKELPEEAETAIEKEEDSKDVFTEEESKKEPEEKSTEDSTNAGDTPQVDKQDDTKESSDKPVEQETSEKEEASTEIDYKAEYEKLLTPFKANNKQIQIGNVDDAINLMKMGANYNKKMSGLKPHMKLMKMLDNNGLLDETKLSHLIDLDKKNPAAIAKFIKDSGVDPLDLDTEAENNYKPNTYTVNDKEVELDSVLDDIRDTASFKDTIDIISNKMDEPSKQILLDNPDIIRTINEHVTSGIYGQIMHVVENERILGRLTGLTDLQAYKQVGDTINANGGFNNQPKSNPDTLAPKEEVVDNTVAEAKRTAKKKAAGSTQKPSSKSRKPDFDPLNMSDAEFEKMTAGTFI